jgi:hypothetical protein
MEKEMERIREKERLREKELMIEERGRDIRKKDLDVRFQLSNRRSQRDREKNE